MKNKNTLILLLLVTIGIWGYLVMEIVNVTGEDIPTTKSGKRTSINKINADTMEKSQTLLLQYPDPFLRNNIRPQTGVRKTKPLPAKPTAVNWPQIRYLGSIGSDQQSRIAMLVIDNQEMCIAISKELNGIKVAKIYSDSVTLIFAKQIKTVIIN